MEAETDLEALVVFGGRRGADARFIAPLGAHCIEVGPVNASIHQVDENVRVADLEALPALYFKLIEKLLV